MIRIWQQGIKDPIHVDKTEKFPVFIKEYLHKYFGAVNIQLLNVMASDISSIVNIEFKINDTYYNMILHDEVDTTNNKVATIYCTDKSNDINITVATMKMMNTKDNIVAQLTKHHNHCINVTSVFFTEENKLSIEYKVDVFNFRIDI